MGVMHSASSSQSSRAARNPASDLLENELAQDLTAASRLLVSVLGGGMVIGPKARANIEAVSQIVDRGIETCLGLAAVLDAATTGGGKAMACPNQCEETTCGVVRED
jgi:hypothetical protein